MTFSRPDPFFIDPLESVHDLAVELEVKVSQASVQSVHSIVKLSLFNDTHALIIDDSQDEAYAAPLIIFQIGSQQSDGLIHAGLAFVGRLDRSYVLFLLSREKPLLTLVHSFVGRRGTGQLSRSYEVATL